jgi:O-antigen/teichoic acid export membrane protein
MVSVVSFPMLFGLAAVAPDLIPILLGPHWEPAVIALRGCAVVVPLGLANTLILSALKASGRADVSLANVVLGSVIMLAAFAVGSRWGLVGLSLSWVVAYPIYFAATLARSAPALGTRPFKLAAGMGGPFLVSVVMLLLIAELHEVLEGVIHPAALLALLVVLGAGLYVLMMFVTQRVRLLELFALVRLGKARL